MSLHDLQHAVHNVHELRMGACKQGSACRAQQHACNGLIASFSSSLVHLGHANRLREPHEQLIADVKNADSSHAQHHDRHMPRSQGTCNLPLVGGIGPWVQWGVSARACPPCPWLAPQTSCEPCHDTRTAPGGKVGRWTEDCMSSVENMGGGGRLIQMC